MILSVWEETMRSKEKSDLDWFIFSGIEMELEEVKEERDLVIKSHSASGKNKEKKGKRRRTSI